MRSLTRLKSLQALEASARHGSFVGAAAELCVTPAAVGQLVRSLEEWVGYPLLKRTRSGNERLTPVSEARAALEEICAGLDQLEAGLTKLRGRRARKVLVVTASQVFAANWLMARLDNFSDEHPDIDVRLDVADQLTGVAYGEADVGIRCGLGSWQGLESTLLMDEEVIAVCSPNILPKEPITPSWIASQTLIHDDTLHPGGKFPTWSDWLTKAGVNSLPSGRGLHVNSTAAVIQGAIAGRGVALIRKLLAAQEIDVGRLHHLMPERCWPIRWSYYVVAPPRALRRSEVKAFRDWILRQVRTYQRARYGADHPVDDAPVC